MKFLKSPKDALTSLLILLLVVSCFWIVKSEIRAASLQSRLDEHHNQLKNNSDELDNLKQFMRRAGNNIIYIDKDMLQLGSGKSTLQFKGDLFNVNMRSGKIVLELSEPDKLVQLINESSKIKLKDDKITIEAKGDITIGPSPDKTLGYVKDEDYIYMAHKDSRIYLGELTHDGKSVGNGIHLLSKSNGPRIEIMKDKIALGVPSKDSEYYQILVDPTKQIVGLWQGQSKVIIKKDNIEIEALGDINITSKNGKVNINGKR
jgi:hypothetical protein